MGWVRAGYGMTLIAVPERTAGLLARGPLGFTGRTVVRVLGMREAGQAIVCAPRPTASVLRLGAGVDALHALTMLAVGIQSRAWRRPALASVITASTFAVLAVRDARRVPRPVGRGLQSPAGPPPHLLDQLLDRRDRYALSILHAVQASSEILAHPGGGR